jgi:hypothetical protein
MLDYQVKPIDYQDCKEWFLKKHYAKRMPPIEFCFGLYYKNVLIGVCSFSTPASRFEFTKFALYELNRLVINEDCKKNSLSYFVSNCLKLMPKPCIIVSYADQSQGHQGYIYQATNWIYTGLSSSEKRIFVNGKELHRRTIYDTYGTSSIQELSKKHKIEFISQLPKHRYFYFVGDKWQKKQMMKELPYEIQPYPKGDNKRYDATYEPTTQIKLL